MGEIADMILDGLLDEETGELIDGEAPGYPRRMADGKPPWPFRKVIETGKDVRCPVCPRRFRTDYALARHRAAKAH